MGILIFLENNLIEIVKVISVEQWQTETHVTGVFFIYVAIQEETG